MSLYALSPDAFAHVAQYLPLRDLVGARRLSKHIRALVDSDVVWATYAWNVGVSTEIAPEQPSGWRQLFQQVLSLHRALPVPANAPRIGSWVPVVSAVRSETSVRFHEETLAAVDAQCGQTIISRAAGTHSVGIVLALPSLEKRSPTVADYDLLLDLHHQLLPFLGFQSGDAAALFRSWVKGPDCGVTSLETFNVYPKVSQKTTHHRAVFCLRCGPVGARQPATVAQMIKMMLSTCSTVVFLSHTSEDLHHFVDWYGGQLSTVDAAAFSTADNTPRVMFVTEEPHVRLNSALEGIPVGLMSWLSNRTSEIVTASMSDRTIFTKTRMFTVPSWINPTVTASVSPSAIVRMIRAIAERELSPWCPQVMEYVCGGDEQAARRVYEDAMTNEFTDATRCAAQEAELLSLATPQVPMDPLELVERHNDFFYVTIRRYSLMLGPVFGRDTEAGLRLLEILKRNISDRFRTYWRRNNAISKEYCSKLYLHTFASVHDRINTPESRDAMLKDKRGLKKLYQCIQDKIFEYQLKARGVWDTDILSEYITEVTIPHILDVTTRHVDQDNRYWAPDAVADMCNDLRSQVIKMAAANTRTDYLLAKAQQDSALYTAFLSNEWASNVQGSTVMHLHSIRADAEMWEQQCMARIRELTALHRGQHAASAALSSATGAEDTTGGITDTEDIAQMNDVAEADQLPQDGDFEPQNLMHTRAAQRNAVIQAALDVQSVLKAQADRLASQLPESRFSNEHRVVVRHTTQKKSVVSRFVSALKRLTK